MHFRGNKLLQQSWLHLFRSVFKLFKLGRLDPPSMHCNAVRIGCDFQSQSQKVSQLLQMHWRLSKAEEANLLKCLRPNFLNFEADFRMCKARISKTSIR